LVNAVPRVSICMPVYNGGDYFGLALDSALSQDYENLEIIVVNDGSTDGGYTEEVARSRKDERIRYFVKENGGVASALNVALREATGDYFAWLSHDDLHLPHKTSAQIAFLAELGRPDLCLFSDYDLIDPVGKLLNTVKLPRDRIRAAPMLPLYNGMINGCSLLIPMQYMRDYGPFDENLRYTQDYDMWLRILRDHEFVHQPEVLIQYRLHPGQDTNKPGVVAEVNPLWTRMLDTRSPTERAHMFGGSFRFFDGLGRFLDESHAKGAAAHAHARAGRIMEDTLTSVIVPFFNEVPLACRAVRSALDQLGATVEVIVVDDGSTEDITPILELAEVTPQVRVLRQRNAGPAAARNRGLQVASGEYIAFLDADDVFLPGKIVRQVERMAANGAAFSHTSYYVDFPEHTAHLGILRSGRLTGNVYPQIIGGCPIAMPTVMLHRSVVDAGFAFPTGGRIGEDVVAWVDLASRYLLLGIDEPLSIVGWSAESAALNIEKQIVGLSGIHHILSTHALHGQYPEELAVLTALLRRYSFLWRDARSDDDGLEKAARSVSDVAWELDLAFEPHLLGRTRLRKAMTE